MVKILASCFFVEMYFIKFSPDGLYVVLTLPQKW